jgi:hypothetical protein
MHPSMDGLRLKRKRHRHRLARHSTRSHIDRCGGRCGSDAFFAQLAEVLEHIRKSLRTRDHLDWLNERYFDWQANKQD